VAVSDKITGPYKDALGKPLLTNKDCFASKHSWASIDPDILIDDDGTPYIIWGNKECYYAKLKDNMTEIDGEIHRIDVPNFTEAPWMHKYNGKYYFSYSTGDSHYLCYAIGDNPYGPFTYQGVILDPVVGWTTHHSIVEFKGQWYLCYHDCVPSNDITHLRSLKVQQLFYNTDGTIQKVVNE